jgi:uncharacterized phiE125 gp8 family phage protein
VASQCLPIQKPIRSTEPTPLQEPVTLAEAKKQCEIAADVSYHDEHIQRLVTAAREQVEHDTGLVCYTGTFTWKLTQFPCGDYFELPGVRPVTSITSITYVDTAGATQTWSSSNYALETASVTPYVRLAYGQSWPTLRGDTNGVTVVMVAGYATVLTIPQRVKQAVLLQLHTQWLLTHEQDAKGQQDGYERLIAALTRSSYP